MELFILILNRKTLEFAVRIKNPLSLILEYHKSSDRSQDKNHSSNLEEISIFVANRCRLNIWQSTLRQILLMFTIASAKVFKK